MFVVVIAFPDRDRSSWLPGSRTLLRSGTHDGTRTASPGKPTRLTDLEVAFADATGLGCSATRPRRSASLIPALTRAFPDEQVKRKPNSADPVHHGCRRSHGAPVRRVSSGL